eukprot:symbB.v1.2.017712.t1/scaffold1384.1/size122353/2
MLKQEIKYSDPEPEEAIVYVRSDDACDFAPSGGFMVYQEGGSSPSKPWASWTWRQGAPWRDQVESFCAWCERQVLSPVAVFDATRAAALDGTFDWLLLLFAPKTMEATMLDQTIVDSYGQRLTEKLEEHPASKHFKTFAMALFCRVALAILLGCCVAEPFVAEVQENDIRQLGESRDSKEPANVESDAKETKSASDVDVESDAKETKNVNFMDTFQGFLKDVFPGVEPPWTVRWACITLTVIAYGWFACGFAGLFTKKDGYTAFKSESGGSIAWYFWLASFLHWVALPMTMLAFAGNATCTGGPSDVAYGFYFAFLVAHIVLMVLAVKNSQLKMAFCDCSKDFFLWGPILVFFLILDHMDMATDALFLGTAVACSDQISSAYHSSWAAIPVIGDELAFTIGELGFSGLAAFCFFNYTYVPQITGQTPFWALITTTICSGIMLLTLHVGWLAGLIALAVVFTIYALAGLFGRQWHIWKQYSAEDETTIGLYSGMGIYEQVLPQGQANERLLWVIMTRLIFENLLQMWMQVSFFSLTFDVTSGEARLKNVASMAISLLVAASKVPGLINELRDGDGWVNLGAGINWGTFMAWVMLIMVIFYAIMLVYITARISFSYYCESHMWGLTTGCMPP